MLVLSRNVSEEIVIGANVIVGVVKTTKNRVFLSISAPSDISIDRLEIWLLKNQSRRTTEGTDKRSQKSAEKTSTD